MSLTVSDHLYLCQATPIDAGKKSYRARRPLNVDSRNALNRNLEQTMHALKFLVTSLGLSLILAAVGEGPGPTVVAQQLANNTDRPTPISASRPFRIDVIDKDSGWAVPMGTLRTTHNLAYVTDNAGRIAIDQG